MHVYEIAVAMPVLELDREEERKGKDLDRWTKRGLVVLIMSWNLIYPLNPKATLNYHQEDRLRCVISFIPCATIRDGFSIL